MMKRILFPVLLAIVGCAGEKPQAPAEPPLPPGYEKLADFEVVFDPADQTVTVRDIPAVGSTGQAKARIVVPAGDVTVRNSAVAGEGYWYNLTNQNSCGASQATWGAQVVVTNNSANNYAGVYAEIYDQHGATPGTEYCGTTGALATKALAPAGLNGNFGVFDYGTLAANGGNGKKKWAFKYVNSTYFTYRGRIVGSTVKSFDLTDLLSNSVGALKGVVAPYGPGKVVLAEPAYSTPFIVDSTGAIVDQGVDTMCNQEPLRVATDYGNQRIWFTTVSAAPCIGYYAATGVPGEMSQIVINAPAGLGASPNLWGLEKDPASSNFWAISGQSGYLVKLVPSGATIVPTSTPFPLNDAPYGLTFGSNGNMYISFGLTNKIRVYSTGASQVGADIPTTGHTSTTCGSVLTPAECCLAPTAIIKAPTTGEVYFIGTNGGATTPTRYSICSVTTTSGDPDTYSVDVVYSQSAGIELLSLCTGKDGDVWAVRKGTGTQQGLLRIKPNPSTGQASWTVLTGNQGTPLNCSTGLDSLGTADSVWVTFSAYPGATKPLVQVGYPTP